MPSIGGKPARLTVRMYNIGFGDCFLITSRMGGSTWRMLVDCGVHSHGAGEHSVSEVVGDVIASCTDDTGRSHLDVVVATHRHRDHVIGFADERWQEVDVGQVWLPWTEDPDDAGANRLRAAHDALAMALSLELEASQDESLALNSLTNEDAMWTLRRGFANADAPRRYVVSEPSTPHPLVGVPGGTVRFLGPGRDPKSLRRLEPPSGERWMRVDVAKSRTEKVEPAFPSYKVEEPYLREKVPQFEVSQALRKKMAGVGGRGALETAAWLDQVLNNTSVVLLLTVGEASLLLPGDAQWGSWLPLLEDAAVRSLLRQTTVYKVSHHGSHNGTPHSLVEQVLSHELTSLVSFRPIERWAGIPKPSLMEQLHADHRRLLSSDGSIDLLPTARKSPDGLWSEIDL